MEKIFRRIVFPSVIFALMCRSPVLHAHELTEFQEKFYGFFNGVAGEPFSAVVIDADTKQPIEGVVAILHWDKVGGHRQVTGFVKMLESKTNKSGQLDFPSWGPKLVWITDITLMQYPRIHIFKTGYEPVVLAEKGVTIHGGRKINRLHLTSSWNGKTIALTRNKDDIREYLDEISSFLLDLDILVANYGGRCYTRNFPFFYHGLKEFSDYFLNYGLGPFVSSVDRSCD